MGVVVVTPATVIQLTTVERVQNELGLSAATDLEILDDMIRRASSEISRECRRVFGRETVTETLDGSGSRLLGLSRTPIVSITSVTENGVALSASEYSIEDAESGAVYRQDGWGRSGGLRMWGTEAYTSGYILPGYQDQRYAVTYTAGYYLPAEAAPTLPGAVEQACLETVKAWYAERTTAGSLVEFQEGDVRLKYAARAAPSATLSLPPAALGLLRNHYARGL